MADITDPRAINFALEKARVIAESALSLYRSIDQFQTLLVEKFENVTPGNANEDVIATQTTNPLYPLTKENMAQLKFVIEQLKTTFETDDRLAVLNRWSVNSPPLF